MAKRKTTQRKKSSTKKSNSKKQYWIFPNENILFLRIELAFLSLLSILIFFVVLFQLDNRVFPTILITLMFIIMYAFVQHIMKHVRRIEEKYQIDGDYLHILRKVNDKIKSKQKIHRNDVNHHKFDKRFLGAYLVTDSKRHPLYFNSLEELKKVETWLGKSTKKKSVKKKAPKKKVLKKKVVKRKILKKSVKKVSKKRPLKRKTAKKKTSKRKK